jgi:hypothetical protein
MLVEMVKRYDARISQSYVIESNPLKIGSLNDVGSMLADVKKYATFVKAISVKCEITS